MKRMNRQGYAEIFPSCLLLAVTFFLFPPLDLYFSNKDEFWFSLGQLVSMVIPITIGVIFFMVLVIGRLANDKLRKFLTALILGCSIAWYFQGNFLNGEYGVLDGKTIDWSSFGNLGMINILLWLLIISFPLVAYLLNKKIFDKLNKYIALFVSGMQIATIFILLISGGGDLRNESISDKSFYFATKDMLEVSKNDNVIVFLLDAFDSEYMDILLEGKNADIYREGLDGFTYFENSAGVYPYTQASIPYILTGQYYENEKPYKEYLDEAFTRSSLIASLHDNNYNVELFTFPQFVSPEIGNLVDNLDFGQAGIGSYFKFAKLTYRLVGFKYLPHSIKQYCEIATSDFEQLKEHENAFGSTDDRWFYEKLIKKGITVGAFDKSFKFYHLNGVHYPFTVNESLELDQKATELDEAKASMTIVLEYIDQLKKRNLYDQTTIIIMADHGGINTTIRSPLFLAKEKTSRGDLKQSKAPIYQGDFQGTIMKAIGKNDDFQYGKSVFDIKEDEQRQRKFLFYGWDNRDSNYLATMVEYITEGDCRGKNSYYQTRTIYSSEGQKILERKPYKFDETLSFDDMSGSKFYFNYGLCQTMMIDRNWSAGKNGQFEIELEQSPTSDLRASFDISEINTNKKVKTQRLIIKCKGNTLYNSMLTGKTNLEFIIPQELIQSKKLILDLEYPDAFSRPTDNKTIFNPKWAVCFSEMKFEETEPAYVIGEKINFGMNGNAGKFFGTSITEGDDSCSWLYGKSGKCHIKLAQPPNSDLEAVIDVKFISDFPNRLIIRSGQSVLFDKNFEQIEYISFPIPKELVKDGIVDLDFEMPDATSEKERGEGNDDRIVSFGINYMVINQIGLRNGG